MRNLGKRLSREEREMRLSAARQWRIDNKPYFDAIYGPARTDMVTCGACGGAGKLAA